MNKTSGAAVTVTRLADDPRNGMTLGELNQFLQEAFASGIDPRAKVLARVGYSYNLKAVEVRE